jgi:hypothetical protein
MVKITFRPWDEVVVHEVAQYEPEALYTLLIQQALASDAVGAIPGIYWANGVAFAISLYPDTEEIVREKLKGVTHYAVVQFALVPEHRPEAWLNLGGTEYRIRLQNVDSHPVLAELARALKERASAPSASSAAAASPRQHG